MTRTARGLGAIVVMPEAARGFYANWWNTVAEDGPAGSASTSRGSGARNYS